MSDLGYTTSLEKKGPEGPEEKVETAATLLTSLSAVASVKESSAPMLNNEAENDSEDGLVKTSSGVTVNTDSSSSSLGRQEKSVKIRIKFKNPLSPNPVPESTPPTISVVGEGVQPSNISDLPVSPWDHTVRSSAGSSTANSVMEAEQAAIAGDGFTASSSLIAAVGIAPKKTPRVKVGFGTSPWPELEHPTPEECAELKRLLTKAHGSSERPDKLVGMYLPCCSFGQY